MIRILFVCHGNICRSPMAEFIMKELVRREGCAGRFLICSAATSTEEIGNPVDRRALAILRKNGIPYTPRTAVQLTREDGKRYDYLIGMDSWNLRNMRRILGPDAVIYRLLDFTGQPADVSDPWYTDRFDVAYADILRGCKQLFLSLQEA